VQQSEFSFFWCAVAFAVITSEATSDDIFPASLTTARTGQDVIEAQFDVGRRLATILALIMIASIDILSRKFDLKDATSHITQ
jgi:hypothetical protein